MNKEKFIVDFVVLVIGAEKLLEKKLSAFCLDRNYVFKSKISNDNNEFLVLIHTSNSVYLMNSKAASFEFFLNLELIERINYIEIISESHSKLNEYKLCNMADNIILIYNCYYQKDLRFHSVTESAFIKKANVILLHATSTCNITINNELLNLNSSQIYENNDTYFIKNKEIFSLFISMLRNSISKKLDHLQQRITKSLVININ